MNLTNKPKILISACLLGENCKYNGANNFSKSIYDLKDKVEFIPICPEQLGGLSTPRDPSEIKKGIVITNKGENVDKQFLKGATLALEIAKKNNIKYAILKSHSPSCGFGEVYDGNFKGVFTRGNGKTAEMLVKNEIKIFSEKDENEIKKLIER